MLIYSLVSLLGLSLRYRVKVFYLNLIASIGIKVCPGPTCPLRRDLEAAIYFYLLTMLYLYQIYEWAKRNISMFLRNVIVKCIIFVCTMPHISLFCSCADAFIVHFLMIWVIYCISICFQLGSLPSHDVLISISAFSLSDSLETTIPSACSIRCHFPLEFFF